MTVIRCLINNNEINVNFEHKKNQREQTNNINFRNLNQKLGKKMGTLKAPTGI